ncbi:mechanosensitive ion channel family protein [Nafulsella turpanensis]|uniref:mechanosensitive ion channel family protein n=1 Tax=Nafulsella turpanensis TaxID=1265690 RepID=UPI000344F8D9|nr:mechanosensitive ion channel domain-containing protein [Nafulsella turpanensis]
MDDVAVYVDQLTEMVVVYGFNLLMAILILIVGWWLIGRFVNVIGRVMAKREVDESLRPFLESIMGIMLKVVLLLSVVSVLGVPTASFLAVLGSAGLAIGLALQGSLSNFAGGVLILTVKPFRKGDFIQAMGVSGTVHIINLLNTVLKTPDNQTIYMPNGQLAGATITNFSVEPTRRLVINFGISYKDDIEKAKDIIRQEAEADPRVLKEPAPSIVVSGLLDNAVNVSMRIWTTKEDYWDVNFALHEQVKQHFDRENITIPFPQRDLHVYQHAFPATRP